MSAPLEKAQEIAGMADAMLDGIWQTLAALDDAMRLTPEDLQAEADYSEPDSEVDQI